MAFAELGLSEEDIPFLQDQIGYVLDNCSVEALALTTETGFQILFVALPTYNVDSDSLMGVCASLTMTGSTALSALFQSSLKEIILRAKDGYVTVSIAGRFVLVGAGQNIDTMMKTVKIFRKIGKLIGSRFPAQ